MKQKDKSDTIIIGSGIAGLYYAYKNPKLNYIILEKNDYIGGRLKMTKFHNKPIVCGAGVGRWNKDILLKQLLDELNIPVKKITNKKSYFPKLNFDSEKFIREIISTLKNYHKIYPKYIASFRDIMLKLFNNDIFQTFVTLNGYGDFVNEDFRETIYHYGLEDNTRDMDIFSVHWDLLVKKLVQDIGRKNIKTNHNVQRICKSSDGNYLVYCETYCGTYCGTNKIWHCKNLVLATDIFTIHKFFPGNLLYKYISGQSFSRIYVKLDKQSTEDMKQYINGYTIIQGPLQKIIPMYVEDGIYMIGYNDNENAELTKNLTNREISFLVQKTLGIKIHVLDSRIIYWKNGTHYFKPYFWRVKEWPKYMEMMQNPDANVKVIGEAFSFNQGWVEGALESVKNIQE